MLVIGCIAIAAVAADEVAIGTIAGPIAVDGVLDEEAWDSAPPVTVLRRYDPSAGGQPSGRMAIRFLQDAHNLYVGISVTGLDYPVRARLSAREVIDDDEVIGIALDTYHDGRTGSVFRVNPIGVQQDLRYVSGEWNIDWNAIFRSEGRLVPSGYEIEVAIPWRSLKYPSGGTVQDWGVILTRTIPNEGATYAFPVLHRNTPVLFAEEATLVGVRPPKSGSGFEFQPSVRLIPLPVPPQGFGIPTIPMNVLPSLDLRYGVTPDLGVATTVNPDFSQVESDVADVRLNARFAFEYAELRPFFLDGAEFFDDTSETLYSRAIVEPLLGAKVAGRSGGVSVGALHALDLSPFPSVHENGTPGFDADDVAGRYATTTVSRAKGNVFDGGFIGLTLSDKRIIGTADAPGYTGINDTVALDGAIPVGRWTLGGAVAESILSDGAWGQRADATILRGSGDGLGVILKSHHTTPGYRQETGFVNQTGLVDSYMGMDYTLAVGNGESTFRPYVEAAALNELDGDRSVWAGTGQEVVLAGVHTIWTSGELTRQSQTGITVDGWSTSAGYEGTLSRALVLEAEGELAQTLDYGTLTPAQQEVVSVAVVIRPLNPVKVQFAAVASRHHPEGALLEGARFLRARLDWQLSRKVGIRGLAQEDWVAEADGIEQNVLGSLLLTWLESPGTAAFLGWTGEQSLGTDRSPIHLLFIKLSVAVRQ